MEQNKYYNKIKPRRLEKLIADVAEGQASALEQLYDSIKTPVYSYALSLTKNAFDAEDVTHDCVVKVYQSSATYKANGKPMAWILTIAKNLCYTKFNAAKKVVDLSEEDWQNMFASRSDMDAEDRLVVSACLKILSDEERQAVVLHAVGGLKHREIAKMTDLSLSTVLSRYNRALDKLKKALAKE